MPIPPQDFIARWQNSDGAERANYQLFLSELCDFLAVPRPEPSQGIEAFNTYVFDKSIEIRNPDATTSRGFIDLYKRNHFVLEAKQGSKPFTVQTDDNNNLILVSPAERPRRRRGTATRGTHGWDEEMRRAYYQAEDYAKALPEWPPFLVTVDVGHSIELYADFSLTGKAYLPFPDPRTYRILLHELTAPEIQERLRLLWLDPHALDPARKTAEVTRIIAAKLANLARNLEQKYPAKAVAEFLTRCIFTSFAENVELIPKHCWLDLLKSLRDRDNVKSFPPMAESLWQTMNTGGFSPILQCEVKQFNGGLFESTAALPIDRDQLNLLIEAADSDWRNVEPAIFGTLLERALEKSERSSLGAHYTPRAYVERLVIPTLVEPLREDWSNTVAAIADLVYAQKTDEAVRIARDFHRRLCETTVLDPACGSGNFLYVALEHLKRLEGEVLETLASLGQPQELYTVNPHQLLGLELNPRAAVVADLVLWIGYLQWHLRTRSSEQLPLPVISNFHNIRHTDALMLVSRTVPSVDENGEEITEWDGVSKTMHPVTGLPVPDETRRRTIFNYLGVKQTPWPKADFIVGNPPFIGGKDMRQELPGGYTDALRNLYTEVPDSADLVMFWWQRAAELTRSGQLRRFGFITTNSLTQVFNRRVVAQNLNGSSLKQPAKGSATKSSLKGTGFSPYVADQAGSGASAPEGTNSPAASGARSGLSLIFAIPDHPWLKALSTDEETISKAAAVRIAMTVAERGEAEGRLCRVLSEGDTGSEGTEVILSEQIGKIFADLRIGADVTGATALQSNEDLSCPGVKLHGAGFIVSPDEAAALGLGRIPGLDQHIRPYLNGRDLTGTSRNKLVIDLFGLSIAEVQQRFPEVYQWVYDRVKPERDENRRATYSENWWTFGEPRANFRPALRGLSRYIATVETAKHRIFVFLDASVLPDNKLVAIAFDDAYHLGILMSAIHLTWTAANQALLEDRPVYVKSRCFDPFPFPTCTPAQQQTIRDIAERLDAHRKRQQQLHPWLTLTEIYNVLEKLRALDVSSASGAPSSQPQTPVILSEVEGPRNPTPAPTAHTFSTTEPSPTSAIFTVDSAGPATSPAAQATPSKGHGFSRAMDTTAGKAALAAEVDAPRATEAPAFTADSEDPATSPAAQATPSKGHGFSRAMETTAGNAALAAEANAPRATEAPAFTADSADPATSPAAQATPSKGHGFSRAMETTTGNAASAAEANAPRATEAPAFTEQDHNIYNAALIGILRELHDDLDRAVFDAYGWPHNLTSEQILERIVALNAERRAEEASGLIRWLRPEYQAPNYVPTTATLEGFLEEAPAARARKQPWPATIPDQFRVVKDALRSNPLQTAQQIASGFRPASRTRTQEILETLTALGQVRESSGRYSL